LMLECASSISMYGFGEASDESRDSGGETGGLKEDVEKPPTTAGDRGRGGRWSNDGTAVGRGGGASAGVRTVQIEELRLPRVLATEFFLLAVAAKVGGDFVEKPDRVRWLPSIPGLLAGVFCGAVLGLSTGGSRGWRGVA
jgi:hypothetical protein